MTFKPDQVFCVLDFETFSEVDLKKVGAWEYSVHPSTNVLCAAFRVGTRETLSQSKTWAWTAYDREGRVKHNSIEMLRTALCAHDIVLVAHNALFEQVITRNTLARQFLYTVRDIVGAIPPSRWLCTASLAATLALPRNLEGAAAALKLPVQKDMDGRRLMLKWCKPRKPTKNNPSTRHDDADELVRLVEYCKRDVDAEVELFLRAPPLSANEREVWLLDQAINLRGFAVDRPLVKTVLDMVADETEELNRETVRLTKGALKSTTQRDKTLRWLENNGLFLPNLQKETVENAVESQLAIGVPKRILEIRQAISKTSTAKYIVFDQRSRQDARVRDILLYHGASTGRWTATGIQMQNFPRGNTKDTALAAEILLSGDLDLVRMIYGDPMSLFSDCLRSVIVAPKDKVLDVADYAAIEARVLFWVAKHEAGLKAFREGRDLYKEQAADVFGCDPADIVDGSFERFLGKSLVLGAGFNMGYKKFVAACLKQGQEVSEELAQAGISAYREKHRPVVSLWGVIGQAAIAAVQNPKKRYSVNRTAWAMRRGFLTCELPSGRLLWYPEPTIRWEPPPWGGEKRPTLYHWGVDATTKKWNQEKTYGGRLVENVVQAIARDLMAEAMLRIAKKGPWELALSVHDELVAERDLSSKATNRDFCRLMAEVPDWAQGLPVAVAGWEGMRYRK